MRKSYNIPLNDNSMDVSVSPQSNFMPSFFTGNTNPNDSFYMNQSKIPQNTMNVFSPFESKPAKPATNLKSHNSFHESTRRNGPPITSLRSRSPKTSQLKSYAFTNESSICQNGNFNQSNRITKPYESFGVKTTLNTSIKETDMYNRFINKSSTQIDDNEFDNWITVFGYPPNDARFVLSYFSEIGCIKDKKISNSGNWMHIQYESKMHAVAALNRNGRIINMNVMIGVKPCDDKTVDTPSVNRYNIHIPAGDVPREQYQLEDKEFAENSANDVMNRSMLNGASIRSLTRGRSPSPVELPAVSKPRPGMISRAMSMVFGRK